MRIIGEASHPECKITFYHWNNRYLIKLEKGLLEQTFKVNQYDLSSESELTQLINENFIKEALANFELMEQSLNKAIQSL